MGRVPRGQESGWHGEERHATAGERALVSGVSRNLGKAIADAVNLHGTSYLWKAVVLDGMQ